MNFAVGIIGAAMAYRLTPSVLREQIFAMGMRGAVKAASISGRVAWNLGKFGAKTTWKHGPGAVSFAANAGLFAVRHPYMTVGALGAGAYVATKDNVSPYDSLSLSSRGEEMSLNIDRELEATSAMNIGVAPMGGVTSGAVIRNQRLMESTMGLTQGLHHSRH